MGNPSDLAVEPSGAAQEAWGAQPAPATRWHCLPGPRGGWGLRMTFPLRLPDLVFPSDWCEGPRPTPQLAAGRAWLCGLKQVPLPLWASARGCLLSSQWHVPPGSGWGGLWANCGPVSLKCNSLSSRLPSGWGRLLDLHLLSPAPVHLSTCLHHKGHLRKALLVPHRRNSGRATDWLPPGFRSRQNPLPYAPTARPAPAPSTLRGTSDVACCVHRCIPRISFTYLFMPFLKRKKKSLHSAAEHVLVRTPLAIPLS